MVKSCTNHLANILCTSYAWKHFYQQLRARSTLSDDSVDNTYIHLKFTAIWLTVGLRSSWISLSIRVSVTAFDVSTESLAFILSPQHKFARLIQQFSVFSTFLSRSPMICSFRKQYSSDNSLFFKVQSLREHLKKLEKVNQHSIIT